MESVPVGRLLDDLVEPALLAAVSRDVRFTVDAPHTSALVNCDAPVLVAAIMNLLTNAIKFTKTHGQVILRTKAEGSTVVFEVEDECGGFPELAGDPFQPFVLRRSTDRSGLGLGLSIARQAVEAHGGNIAIRNRPSVGCTFVVTLPLVTEATTV